MFFYSEVGRDNPRSRLKTHFNLDALYLLWFISMVLITWMPRPYQGLFEITREYQCSNPDRPGSGVQWKCGDTQVRIFTQAHGTKGGPAVQGFPSSMGSVRIGPENYFTNEYLCPSKLTRRPQQAIGWVYKAF